jgi:hypothetical protein
MVYCTFQLPNFCWKGSNGMRQEKQSARAFFRCLCQINLLIIERRSPIVAYLRVGSGLLLLAIKFDCPSSILQHPKSPGAYRIAEYFSAHLLSQISAPSFHSALLNAQQPRSLILLSPTSTHGYRAEYPKVLASVLY